MTVCPKCKGYGIIGDAVPDILRGRGAIFSSNECDMCHGKGEVQTNEEYLKSLGTEQLAEELLMATMSDVLYAKIIPCKTHEDAIRVVMEWLKQPHKE